MRGSMYGAFAHCLAPLNEIICHLLPLPQRHQCVGALTKTPKAPCAEPDLGGWAVTTPYIPSKALAMGIAA